MAEITRKIALYPGSFDGLTYGHLDLIQRGRNLFDHLIVAVADNSRKTAFFTAAERVEQLQACTHQWPNVQVLRLEGLTIQFAANHGAQFLMRGLRAVSDFEFEFQMAIMNHEIQKGVETIFLAPAPEWVFLSSSMVKEVWRLGGYVSQFVPPTVLAALEGKRAIGAPGTS